jgi:hypothetical protein
VEPERFEIVFPQRRILPVSVAIAAAVVVFAQGTGLRVACGVLALATVGIWLLLRRARPEVVVDERGYAVQEFGREKLRVGWSEVQKVRADPAEHALYVDCGDPARNLLVPPRRGWGFHFPRARELYARIVDAVGDKVELVERLDPRTPPKP